MGRIGNQDYTVSISADETPEEAFAAINNVGAWWDGQITGTTDKIGVEFTYQCGDFHLSTQEVTELVPGKRVAWLITKGGPKFVSSKNEWKDTRVVFEISRKGNETEVRFTHKGLIPRMECYDSCSDAWGSIIRGSIRNLIATGKGGAG